MVLRRPPRPPLPPSAHDVLREARLLRALESTPARVPRVLAVCEDPAVIGCPFYVMERVEGEVIVSTVPERAGHARRTQRDRRGADRGAGGDPRRRLAGGGPRGIRQADRLPGAPAEALRGAVGAEQDARDRGDGTGGRLALRAHAELGPRRRSCTATIASATRCSPPAPLRGWWPCSTGRWRRSATRWPISATCAGCGPSATIPSSGCASTSAG